MSWLLVFLGGGIGAVLRHAVTVVSAGSPFPVGTLMVNVLGSALMGAAAVRFAPGTPHALLLITGLLGGFTTFSAFSLDTVALWQRGAPALALAYAAGSVFASIAGLVAGMAAARSLS